MSAPSSAAKQLLGAIKTKRFASSRRTRVDLLKSIAKFCQTNQDEPAAVYKMVFQLVAPMSHILLDRPSRLAALAALQEVLRVQDAVLQVAIPVLAQEAAPLATFPTTGLGYALTLLDWVCEVIKVAAKRLSSDAKEEWTALAKIVGVLLTCLLAGPHKTVTRAKRVFNSIFNKVPEALDKLVDAVLSCKKKTPSLCGLCSALCLYSSSVAKESSEVSTKVEKLEPVFVALLQDCVLPSTKQPTTPSVFVASAPMLQCLRANVFEVKLLPDMSRCLKRNIDSALPAYVWFLETTTIELGPMVATITKTLEEHVKSKTDAHRTHAIAAYKALALHCSDTGAITATVSKLLDMLAGKPTKIINADHRESIAKATGAVSFAALSNAGKAEIAGNATEKLIDCASKESHPGVAEAIVETLSRFAETAKSIDAKLVDFAKKTLEDTKSKSTYRVQVLLALNAACKNSDVKESSSEICKILSKHISAKSTTSIEVVLSATILRRISLASGDVDLIEASKQSKLWERVVDDKVFSDKLFNDSSTPALEVVAELVELILGSDLQITLPKIKWSMIYNCAVKLLLHPLWKIQLIAGKRLRSLVAAAGNKEMLASLFGEFIALSSNSASASRGNLEKAFMAIASIPQPFETHLMTIIPAHLPCLPHSQAKHRWCTSLKANGCTAEKVFAENTKTIVEIITTSLGTENSSAAIAAISTFAALPGNELVIDMLLESTIDTLNDSEFGDVTYHEIAVSKVPDGQLFSEQEASDEDEIAKLNPNTKDYEEQLWELKVKLELARKNKAKMPVKKLSKSEQDQRKAKLADEKSTRERVKSLRQVSNEAFSIVLSIASGPPSGYASIRATHAIPTILKHVSYALTGSKAVETYIAFGHKVDQRLSSLIEPLGYSILLSKGANQALPHAWRRINAPDALIGRCMRQLWAVTNDAEPIDITSFTYCWPLVQNILTRKSLPVAVYEDAMVFLTAHVDFGRSKFAPRRDILTLLVEVAANLERLALQASVFMKSFVEQMMIARSGGVEIASNEIAVIVRGLQIPEIILRKACFDSLCQISADTTPTKDVLLGLWLAKHDVGETLSSLASDIWMERDLQVPVEIFEWAINGPLSSTEEEVRKIAAKAVAGAVVLLPDSAGDLISKLSTAYLSATEVPEPERDHLGNIISEPFKDPWWYRLGLCLVLGESAEAWPTAIAVETIRFIVECCIHDVESRVRDEALNSGRAVINAAGSEILGQVIEILETAMAQKNYGDFARQALVILLGASAKHMAKDDPRVPEVLDSLLASLATPSQTVQEAVGLCISPLMAAIKPRVPALLEQLLGTLMDGPTFGARRGAAYGIAGVVKGAGVVALKQYGLNENLKEAIENKKNAKHREGALMAYELICTRLGRIFEPYVIHILPNLLICYGDGNADVRTAATEASAAIMSKLSSHGVKLVLPSLLTGLEDHSWKVKQGSIQLLAAMSGCAPKQLSACLPSIVPKLQETLSDSHQKVQNSGREALNQIGKVIKNPEIQAIVPKILAALDDHELAAQDCLTALLETAFVHVIDAPSLALIMPILQRAMTDRSIELKKSSAQIIGNMYTLTDAKDLAPYLPALLPGIKVALLDPDPSVRGIAAKAMGSIMKGMGEANFPDLIPWLLDTLQSKDSSVDRSGAAQGLSEVLYALGIDKFNTMLPEFMEGTKHPVPHVREGHLMLFVYLPVTFKSDFRTYIESIVPCLLRGLSDGEEGVRDTAMRAAGGIISNFSDTSIELLMPELERGLLDDSWRIRESSVKLLGELLFQLSGVSGKQSTDATGGDDDSFGTDEAELAIVGSLGKARRNRVLAGLFMARQDSAVFVRQASNHVWKVVVSNTAKTLRDTLPELLSLLLNCLGDEADDKRETAARTLSEVLRKLGERVLPTVFPILERNVTAESRNERLGVCLSFTEILRTCSADQMEQYTNSLIRSISALLVDDDDAVRKSASTTFHRLHVCIGPQAIEEILPPMLTSISEEVSGQDTTEDESEDKIDISTNNEDAHGDATESKALDGLRHIMATMSKIVLPYVVPKLLAPPLSPGNASALASLAAVAGAALNSQLGNILEVFMEQVGKAEGEAAVTMQASLRSLVLAVDDNGIGTVLDLVQSGMCDDVVQTRRTCATLLADVCRDSRADLEDYNNDLIDTLIGGFCDVDERVVYDAWGGLNAFLKRLQNDKGAYLSHMIGELKRITAKDASVHGFGIADGVTPFLTFFVESITTGTPHMRLDAIEGLGYLVTGTEQVPLQKYALKITGPIIRVASESSGNLKAACLIVVCKLLGKIPAKLKTMLPQLQTTCLKALRDSADMVRNNALIALSKLAPLQRRVDPIFTDLCTGVSTAEDNARLVFLKAITGVSASGAAKIAGAPIKAKVVDEVLTLLEDDEEDVREWAGRALGALSPHLDDDGVQKLLQAIHTTSTSWSTNQGSTFLLRDMLIHAEDLKPLDLPRIIQKLDKQFASGNTSVEGASVAAAVALLAHSSFVEVDNTGHRKLERFVSALLESKETHREVVTIAVTGFGVIGRWKADLSDSFIAFAIPLLQILQRRAAVSAVSEIALVLLLGMDRNLKRESDYLNTAPEAKQASFKTLHASRLVHVAPHYVGRF